MSSYAFPSTEDHYQSFHFLGSSDDVPMAADHRYNYKKKSRSTAQERRIERLKVILLLVVGLGISGVLVYLAVKK